MPVFVEFSTAAAHDASVENGFVEQSESLASGAVSAPAPTNGYVTLTADENGYVAFSHGTPSAAGNPRRRLLSGVARSFAVSQGMKLSFTAG